MQYREGEVRERAESAAERKGCDPHGSRARGDHRADSDWDIAFITSTKESLPNEVLQDLNELGSSKKINVHDLAVPQNDFDGNANSLGNVVSSIARGGWWIAGHCQWTDTESELIMKPDVYKDRRAMALKQISSAVNNFAESIVNARTSSDRTAFKSFVKHTADAADFFAKIAFEKTASGTSKKYPYSRKVDDIVQAIDRKIEDFEEEKAKWWRCDRGREFRDPLRAMNGYGHDDHRYETKSLNSTMRRSPVLQIACLLQCSSRFGRLKKFSVLNVCDRLRLKLPNRIGRSCSI